VYNEKELLIGMITTAAVARWLGKHPDGIAARLDVPASKVMESEEYPRAYRVLRTSDTVGKALAAFKEQSDLGEPLYGIVLTDDGNHDFPPRGVITLFDVPRLWSMVRTS
jgi:hypothetical protein